MRRLLACISQRPPAAGAEKRVEICRLAPVLILAALGVAAASDAAELEAPGGTVADGDWPMWGGTLARNMVSDATGLPAEWDTDAGVNVKWVEWPNQKILPRDAFRRIRYFFRKSATTGCT